MQKRAYLISAIIIAVIFLFILFGGNEAQKQEPSLPAPDDQTSIATTTEPLGNTSLPESSTLPTSQ